MGLIRGFCNFLQRSLGGQVHARSKLSGQLDLSRNICYWGKKGEVEGNCKGVLIINYQI